MAFSRNEIGGFISRQDTTAVAGRQSVTPDVVAFAHARNAADARTRASIADPGVCPPDARNAQTPADSATLRSIRFPWGPSLMPEFCLAPPRGMCDFLLNKKAGGFTLQLGSFRLCDDFADIFSHTDISCRQSHFNHLCIPIAHGDDSAFKTV